MKISVSKEKSGVCVVVDYTDTWFSNFAIKYLHENEKFRETVFAFSYGAQVESFKQKRKWSKISWHCPASASLSAI